MRHIEYILTEILHFSILALIILEYSCNYPSIGIYQTRPVTEIQVFYPMYGECSRFTSVGSDGTRILSPLGRRTSTPLNPIV